MWTKVLDYAVLSLNLGVLSSFFLQVGYSKFQCGAVMGVTTATSQFLFQHDYAPVYKTKCIQDLFGDWPAENPAP